MKLIKDDEARPRLIHFDKCPLKRLELVVKLINDFLLQVLVTNDLPNLLLALLILHDNFLLILLILWVLHAVVPEIKSFSWLDNLAEPPTKVSIVYLRGLFDVFHLDQDLKDIEVEFRVATRSSNELREILSCYEPVIVLVKVQESLSDRDPIV